MVAPRVAAMLRMIEIAITIAQIVLYFQIAPRRCTLVFVAGRAVIHGVETMLESRKRKAAQRFQSMQQWFGMPSGKTGRDIWKRGSSR